MKKTIGSILTVGGLVALVYTGINYINNTESFGFLGADFVVSQGDPVPVVLSAVVLVLGVVLVRTKG